MDKYKDIINIPHFEPRHPRMSLYNRSAQFAPFAALTGYEDAVKEKGRLTSRKQELTSEEKLHINDILVEINDSINEHPEVKITYFVKDEKKQGGKNVTTMINIKKLDKYNQIIMFEDNTKVKIDDIIALEIIK